MSWIQCRSSVCVKGAGEMFDVGKFYKTRCGLKVRLISTNGHIRAFEVIEDCGEFWSGFVFLTKFDGLRWDDQESPLDVVERYFY